MASASNRWWIHEDWLAVWLGLATLIVVPLGLRPALPAFKWASTTALGGLFNAANLQTSLILCAILFVMALPGALALGAKAGKFALGFLVVFALSWLAQLIAGNSTMAYWGIEYVIFALVLGLLFSNVIGCPAWLMEAVRTEYFIKSGLVIMGATILFQDIMEAGVLGMLQAVLVVVVVWYFSFWLCRRLKLDDEFSAMLSTAVSICGVSAAIAACGAIHGDRRRLSYVASVVLIVAVPMIVIQPWLIKTMGLSDVVGGAWLGGTLDTTGSVVAAGSLISETAMKMGTIVKFSQNVLIGVAAFLLSVWWSMKSGNGNQPKASARVIWERFPKFVIGFVAASLVFSFLVDPAVVKATKGTLTGLRTAWFALAFACIGLETKFTDLLTMENGRPFFAFLGAQTANVIWTLILAWLIFGGMFFAVPKI
ncbi:YeiH family protein [Paludibaculum fermentans]|uniref:Putative sulfate exporter family transporter n=1 Tax=Paludibaculum fermentans TaxID=1473598 RepID=A0A7S7NNM1_PALFE|nr:putative sulfate exporter family transporter [Paludibaculum fermentans]QOY86951.1 putative sulfate exporter family transporter [Paludibaculum fermentans]